MDALSYHVFVSRDGGLWLHHDEHTWTRDFLDSADFSTFEPARDIGERENKSDHPIYVMAVMPS